MSIRRNRKLSGINFHTRKLVRIVLPILFVLLVLAGLSSHARLSEADTPTVSGGILDLSQWNGDRAFELSGQWEFYWGSILSAQNIQKGDQPFILVNAPGKWNNYKINGVNLPGTGKATYRIRVTGAKPGEQYGIRIQNTESAFRIYIDNTLVAQNGNFCDTQNAPISGYRPQLVSFTPENGSFDLIVQISTTADSMGGMWEPIVFGTYGQTAAFDVTLSNIGAAILAGFAVLLLFSLIFFAAQRGEKDMLILALIIVIMALRFLVVGDVWFSVIFPGAPVAWIDWIDFLSIPWSQFLLLYFIYRIYGRLVPKWQFIAFFAYTVAVTLVTLLLPLRVTTAAYMVTNLVLLFTMAVTTAHLARAAWKGLGGAPFLLFAALLILGLIFYKVFVPDYSTLYYLLNHSGVEYIVFVLAYVAVVAQRYRRAQALEIAHLKGQIRPHFIHNALTAVISISRTDPDRSRELLGDFSSYLRSFYDYDRDELVPFSRELELVRAYAALEQARFGEKLRIEYQIGVEDFLLPALILQPLVENAFVHGLREKENGGTVTVYARLIKKGRVRVGVRDDGVGFGVDSAATRQGVGIENINRRLARLYRTSLVYTEPEGGGCEVYFEIPFKKEAAKRESLAD